MSSLAPYTVADLAADYKRNHEWASRNWRELVAAKKLPPPLIENGPPVWDRAQVYAYRDKVLPAAARALSAAVRAAFDAAHGLPGDALYHDDVAADRARLDRRFAGSGQQAGGNADGN